MDVFKCSLDYGFNSNMVRLKEWVSLGYRVDVDGFNSNMVRLKVT